MKEPVILIIDDDDSVRESIRTILRKEKYQLYFAENGKEGLTLVKKHKPNVIILDLKMPVLDGPKFLSLLKPSVTDNFSVIVLTGYASDKSIRDCYKTGVRFFTEKPVNIYQLRGMIKSALAIEDYKEDLLLEIKVRKKAERKLEETIEELKDAIQRIKTLEELVPMCSYCKKIRTEEGEWVEAEEYIRIQTKSHLLHSVCPDCKKKILSG